MMPPEDTVAEPLEWITVLLARPPGRIYIPPRMYRSEYNASPLSKTFMVPDATLRPLLTTPLETT